MRNCPCPSAGQHQSRRPQMRWIMLQPSCHCWLGQVSKKKQATAKSTKSEFDRDRRRCFRRLAGGAKQGSVEQGVDRGSALTWEFVGSEILPSQQAEAVTRMQVRKPPEPSISMVASLGFSVSGTPDQQSLFDCSLFVVWSDSLFVVWSGGKWSLIIPNHLLLSATLPFPLQNKNLGRCVNKHQSPESIENIEKYVAQQYLWTKEKNMGAGGRGPSEGGEAN